MTDDLRDRSAEQPDDLLVLESHLDLAEERLAEYRRSPVQATSGFEILDDLIGRPR